MVFFRCGCGALYHEYSIHPEICAKSKKKGDRKATQAELDSITYSCGLCGTKTSLPHNCPVFNRDTELGPASLP